MAVTFTLPSRVIVIFGQSQGCNNLGPTLYTVRNSGLKQLNINDGTVSAASEPLLGVSGTKSTFSVEMGDNLLDTGRWAQIILAPISWDGSYSSQWRNGGAYYSRVTSIISQIQALALNVGAIIWMQGEQDAGITEDQSVYVSNVLNAFSAFRNAGIRAPIFVPLETWAFSSLQSNSTNIRAAQAALANPDMQIFTGPDFDTLGNGFRQDGTHFNDPGKSAVAQKWVPYIARLMH